MAIYGSYLAESKSVQEDMELTIEDVNWLSETYVEACIAIAEDTDYEEYGALNEGEANKKSWEAMKQLKKDFKQHASATKKALKKHDQETAEKEVKALRKVLDDTKKAIKSNKSEASDAFFGFFSGLLLFFCHNLVWAVTAAGGVAAVKLGPKNLENKANEFSKRWEGFSKANPLMQLDAAPFLLLDIAKLSANLLPVFVGMGAVMTSFKNAVKSALKGCKRMLTDMKNKEATADTLNSFRNECLVIISDLDKAVMELERAVREMD